MNILSWLPFFKKHKFHRHIFAVTTGKYAGEMLVFIKQTNDQLHFLSLPSMENRIILEEKFDFGLDNHIVEFVELAPTHVIKTSVKQYSKNDTSTR